MSHAVDRFLEPFTECAHSVRITRTDTTLDQDCILKETVHDRVIVDNMYEFQHSSSRAGCTFSMQDSRVKRGSNIGHKTQQARLPTDSGLYNSTFPSLVNCILTIPECRSDHHKYSMVPTKRLLSLSSSRVIGLLKVLRQVGRFSQFTKFRIACCSCSAPCSCSLLS